MQEVNVTELRKHLPDYLKLVVRGEPIRVTSNGKVPGRIVPDEDPTAAARKRLEALRGTMIMDDIAAPIEQLKWPGDEDHLLYLRPFAQVRWTARGVVRWACLTAAEKNT